MARFIFACKFEQKVTQGGTTTTQKALTAGSCNRLVAKELGIDTKRYIPDPTVKKKRAAHSKQVKTIDPATGDIIWKTIQIPEAEYVYMPDGKSKAQKVILSELLPVSPKKSPRTYSLTFPTTLTVGQIGEALAELIDPQKFTGSSATTLQSSFKLKGGRTYPIPDKAKSESSTDLNVLTTQAEQAAEIPTAEPQKPKKP